MKKINTTFCLWVIIHLWPILTYGQYCIPQTAIPYNANMPGITRFKLGTIDRQSADIENFPQNSYVFTDLSTDLTQGKTYDVTITHTIDPAICPDMNLRIWIDLNQDQDFTDPGELVLSENNDPAGTFTGTFTVPANAALGSTRLRCTAKMSSLGGHTLPTPCDVPADPFGYHGEIEDYRVMVLSGSSATTNLDQGTLQAKIFPNPAKAQFELQMVLPEPTEWSVSLCNSAGQQITALRKPEFSPAGTVALTQNTAGFAPGFYLLKIQVGEKLNFQKLVIL